MPAKPRPSVKRIQIDKSQSTMLVAAAIAAFCLAFALVGGKAFVSQISYQNKVISEKKAAVQTLKTNVQTSQNLINSYKAFVTTSQNVIGGNPQGTAAKDGDNAKIVLDALPSKYDFPALASSLEKIIIGQNMQIDTIGGSDDEVNQSSQENQKAEPVPMPFQISATGTYLTTQGLINDLGRSIRPIQIQKLQVSGGQSKMSVRIDAQTYYQPAKNFNITKKDVK